ncbi:hypothetical protein [Heliorestis convoluta]|uniref:Stage III sporulation protein AG n=1 Tax=Heliorestis convoluta TaxID=356322 RepID=A0A5Q2MZD7_9FIRM|nr:hypothetical protein [Heliorestis convoluta]QGG46556.1 stage III sporulation protein AG [Heliorestis convoluta]
MMEKSKERVIVKENSSIRTNFWNLSKHKMFSLVAILFFLGLTFFLIQSDEMNRQSKEGTVAATAAATIEAQNPLAGIQRGSELAAQERLLEERVASALSAIAGVGATEVRVSLAQGTQAEYAINVNANNRTIEEKDKQGGERITTDTSDARQLVVMREGTNSREQPVVVREMRYEIAGVLIIADGAKDSAIKEKISRAVCTLLDVPAHKVSIFPREGGM